MFFIIYSFMIATHWNELSFQFTKPQYELQEKARQERKVKRLIWSIEEKKYSHSNYVILLPGVIRAKNHHILHRDGWIDRQMDREYDLPENAAICAIILAHWLQWWFVVFILFSMSRLQSITVSSSLPSFYSSLIIFSGYLFKSKQEKWKSKIKC